MCDSIVNVSNQVESIYASFGESPDARQLQRSMSVFQGLRFIDLVQQLTLLVIKQKLEQSF